MKASDFKYTATTPKGVTEVIRAFCSTLSAEEPSFVEVRPDESADMAMCYTNAAEVAQRIGGQVVFGWLIWELDGIYVTAEHHAVVETEGKLIDVTPPFAGERIVLFVPDPITEYRSKRITNKYAPLVLSPLITHYVEFAKRNAELIVANEEFGHEYNANDREMTRLLDVYTSLLRARKGQNVNLKKKNERKRSKQGRRKK
jgi:hypothetical protein